MVSVSSYLRHTWTVIVLEEWDIVFCQLVNFLFLSTRSLSREAKTQLNSNWVTISTKWSQFQLNGLQYEVCWSNWWLGGIVSGCNVTHWGGLNQCFLDADIDKTVQEPIKKLYAWRIIRKMSPLINMYHFFSQRKKTISHWFLILGNFKIISPFNLCSRDFFSHR